MKRERAKQNKREQTAAEKEVEEAGQVLQRLIDMHQKDLQARIDRIRDRLDNLTKTP